MMSYDFRAYGWNKGGDIEVKAISLDAFDFFADTFGYGARAIKCPRDRLEELNSAIKAQGLSLVVID